MPRREFQFTDGSSKKFWAIQLEGSSFTVHYGRIGTAGQSQEKTFADEAAAKKEHDKLVAEKTKKGYAEVQADGSVASAPMPAPVKKAATPPAAKATEDAAASSTKSSAASPAAEASASVASATATSSAVSVAAPATLERSIQLSPADYFIVTWKDHAPLRKPEPAPFNLESCLQRLSAVGTTNQVWQQDWRKAKVPDFPTPVEAQFWLLAFELCRSRTGTPQAAAEQLAKANLESRMTLEAALGIARNGWRAPENLFACVAALFPAEDLVFCGSLGFGITQWFWEYVCPYVTAEQRAAFRQKLGPKIAPFIPARVYDSFPVEHYLGALFGCHEELAAVVRGLPDGSYKNTAGQSGYPDYHQRPQWLVFGLADAQTVEAEFRRLSLILRGREQAVAWLALTQFAALDVIAESAVSANSKDEAIDVARPLLLVRAPEAAGPALHILRESKAAQIGLEWLTKNPYYAAAGLVPIAMGQGKMAQWAREHLEMMRHGDAAPTVVAAVNYLPAEQAAWLQSSILEAEQDSLPDASRAELPANLGAAFDAVKRINLPGWLSAGSLPPIKVAGKKLALPEIGCVLESLKWASFEKPDPVVSALKETADRNSLDAFAWKVFDQWNGMGAPSKDKWAMGAIGHLGGDSCVLKLTPLVREWPGEAQHKRAVFGLECLRGVGTDTALMALNGMAQKMKFKALKEKAQAMMEGIAESRGFTREQLADRIVPDCGLDERGSRVFDFGSRQFKFVLGPEMKPLVRDGAGKVRPDLPSPNNSDEKDKAESAVADWKLLKKTLKEVLKVQAERLEDAMITGRRWTPDEFSTLIVKHPLMVNLARQLVFGAFDGEGKLTQSFRVTEDQSLADSNDDPADLPASGGIGVVHPAHLDEATKGSWGQILSDYEIIPPFQQLGRAICRPESDEIDEKEITRFAGPKVPGIVMYGMLERSHWLRDSPADGGGFVQHSKHFPAANITAFIKYSGLSIGYYDEPQELEEIYFVPGHVKPEMWGHHKNRVKIGQVDQVVMSEVLRLANAIVSKGA